MGKTHERFKNLVTSNKETENELTYRVIPGKEDLVEVSFMDDGGKRQKVLIQTFSDQQLELFKRIRLKLEHIASEKANLEENKISI